jgi:hypothetical protein
MTHFEEFKNEAIWIVSPIIRFQPFEKIDVAHSDLKQPNNCFNL